MKEQLLHNVETIVAKGELVKYKLLRAEALESVCLWEWLNNTNFNNASHNCSYIVYSVVC